MLPENPNHWHRRVPALALPIIAANLTQPLMTTVDTIIAGHLPDPAMLGGVALGGLFFNLVFWGFGFLRMATTGLVAQSFGAGAPTEMRDHVLRAILLALAFGLVLVAAKLPLVAGALALLGGSTNAMGAAHSYCAARLWSAPAALANYAVLGTLLGTQRAATALLVQGFINLANMAAALLFVYGFGWSVAGLGRATALADCLGLVLGLGLLWRLRPRGLPRPAWLAVLDAAALRRLFLVNRDIFLRTLCLLACFAWFTHQGAAQGDVILAANALLLNFQTFMSYVLDGFAQAAESLVGAAIGARDRAMFGAVVWAGLLWAAAGGAVFSAIYAIAGPAIIAALTDHEAVRAAARTYLPWAAISPLVSVWSFQFDGIYIGATRTRDLRNSMALAMLVFLVGALTLQPAFGNHGLWAAFLMLMIARAAALGLLLPRLTRQAFAV